METGLTMLPAALVSAAMMPVAGFLYDRFGPKALAVGGLAYLSYTTYLLHYLDPSTPTSLIVTWMALRGLGMSFANMPAQTAAMAVVPVALVGRASALTNIIGRVSGSFGIAVFTSFMTHRTAAHAAELASSLSPTNPAVVAFFQSAGLWGGATGLQGNTVATAYLAGLLSQAAFTRGVDDVFVLAAIVTLAGVIPAFFLEKGGGRGGSLRGEYEVQGR